METSLAGPQVAHWRQSAILPIFVSGKVTEFQADDKSVFLLDRIAHFRQGIIASDLRHRDISDTRSGNECRCVCDSKSLTKPLSKSLGHQSLNRPNCRSALVTP